MNSSTRELLLVAHLGLCFTVLFSCDFTLSYMQKAITSSITEDNSSFAVDGYVTLAITYFAYGLFLSLAPSIISVLGPRFCMVLGSLTFMLHPLSFIVENLTVTYVALVLAGAGGSILWVAEGIYMITASSQETISRNVGVFWFFFSLSMIPGNIYAAWGLTGKYRIDRGSRHVLLGTLTGVGGLAVLLFAALRPLPSAPCEETPPKRRPLTALIATWNVLTSKSIQVLLITFVYTGFQQAFGIGIMGSCIGFSRQFGIRAKELIPESGLCYGLGEILGGLIQILFNKSFGQFKYSRSYAILTGFVFQVLAFILIGLSLPDESVFHETDAVGILNLRVSIWLVLLSAGLVGFGDSALNTQIYPLIASLEPDHIPQSCAIFKFTKSMFMVVYFLLSTKVGLYTQLVGLALSGTASIFAFITVDRWSMVKRGILNL